MAAAITRAALLEEGRAQLAAAGVETPLLDARLLILAALKLDALALLTAPDATVEPASIELARSLVARRAAHEPVARILGEREFRGLRFQLSPGTLEPRPDSEVVVEAALDAVSERNGAPLRLLDLGTGTGCLLIALLAALPGASGTGIDQSADALVTARANAVLNDVAGRSTFAQGDWLDGLVGPYDLVISNPPYITRSDMARLSPEVRLHDPAAALDGGEDGLDAYRQLSKALLPVLAPDAVVVIEIGAGQAGDVTALFVDAGFERTTTRADLGGHIRALVFKLSTGLRGQRNNGLGLAHKSGYCTHEG